MNFDKLKKSLVVVCVLIIFAVSLLVYFQNTYLFGFETTIAITCGSFAGLFLFKPKQIEKINTLPLKMVAVAFVIIISMILLYFLHIFVYERDTMLFNSLYIWALFFLVTAMMYVNQKIIYFNSKID